MKQIRLFIKVPHTTRVADYSYTDATYYTSVVIDDVDGRVSEVLSRDKDTVIVGGEIVNPDLGERGRVPDIQRSDDDDG